jgi:protein SCO1/2
MRAHYSLVLSLALAVVGAGCRQEPALPSFGQAPRFGLTDQQGLPFGSADIGSRVAVANFIYTSCTDTCPLLSANMARVAELSKSEGLFGGKVVLLSFSLDPERDTPQVLAAYGERFGVDPTGWKMLTGEPDVLGQLAQDFKLGRPIPLPTTVPGPLINLAHSNRFVLMDGAGQVRAYYRGEELNVDEVMRDVRQLARR